jgi:hypothetical protein
VPRHRKPARRFQVIAAIVLVLGAVGGGYAVLSGDDEPVQANPGVAAPDPATDPAFVAARGAKIKAEAAAAAAAERARQANELAAAEEAARQQAAQTPSPDVPASCDEYSGNRALGCALLLEAGFGLDQMGCLDSLWTHESNWRETAANPSGAYGIPQALPGDKMAAYGADYLTNPVPQIRWGLDYIKGRYGTPCGAWSNWQSAGWY